MSQYPNHDPAGSSSGQQQENTDEQNTPPFFTNYDYQDPSFLGLEQPSTTTYHDPTSSSFGTWPSQPGVHMQPTSNTSSTFPNQYYSAMPFNGTGMGNLVEPSPSNSFLPMSGASQAAHRSLAQSDVGFGGCNHPVAGGTMGTGQIAGDGQNPRFQPFHQQSPPGNYEGQFNFPSNGETAGEGLPMESSDVEGQHNVEASRPEERADTAEQDTQGHRTGDTNVGLNLTTVTPEPWYCGRCNTGFTVMRWLSRHRNWKCGSCDAAYGCIVHVRHHMQAMHAGQENSPMPLSNLLLGCRWCNDTFKGTGGLASHKRGHFPQTLGASASWACPEEGCTEIQDPQPRDEVVKHMLSRHDDLYILPIDCDPLWVQKLDSMGYLCPFEECKRANDSLEELRRHMKSHERNKIITQQAPVAPVSQPGNSDMLPGSPSGARFNGSSSNMTHPDGEEDERLVSGGYGGHDGPNDQPEQHPSPELQHQGIESVPLADSSDAGTSLPGTQAHESTLQGGQAQPQQRPSVNSASTGFKCPACAAAFSTNAVRSAHIAWSCPASPRTERRNSPIGKHLAFLHEGKGPVVEH
ncbi:hypothetical protein B0H65DRAFT_523263 [Neurospora tetraspora]|uniref:C2H2-type domain-containing protein n=1 Tax=Neurospora tetraspora TaxID=94610 RepID=A0AAE0JIQ3_9PEZI|nr:hypothetical protein B0H65DRAFT_523263 [Neurospora tetraspora]